MLRGLVLTWRSKESYITLPCLRQPQAYMRVVRTTTATC